ncbi:MAG: sigma-70 family RNA polymerase sigma factor [Fimbriimonadaceae bacterium]
MDDLTTRVANGDRAAMARIVTEHFGSVYAFCARRLGPDLAEDAAQETFIMAYKTIQRYDPACALRTWLIGIAFNICRNMARKKRRDIQLDQIWHLPDASKSETEIVLGVELACGLRKLSPVHLEVVMLHELDGLTYDETALVLGIPAGTVKSRLHEAFRQLRKTVSEVER